MATEYLIDKDRREARRRLAVQERVFDPITRSYLERIGVGEGWSCLELGAGGGSVAAWLADRVGPRGRVLAADLETGFLDELDLPNLEVRRLDVAAEDLERGAFDLVHARDLLVHIPEREAVLKKMAEALKPGGWILAEEPDVSSDIPDPLAPEAARRLYSRLVEAIYSALRERGLDPNFGARLPGLLYRLGFESVHSEGWCRTYRGGQGADASPHMMAFPDLQELVTSSGGVTAGEFQDFLALADDPAFSWREGITVAAWGRRG